MVLRGIWAGLYRICQWVMRLAYVNVLWLIFTLIGFILLGVMPATISMFTIVRKWVMKDIDIPVFPTFFQTYKKEFIKSNFFTIIISLAAIILYINLRYTGFMINSSIYPVLLGILFIAIFFYAVLLIYIAPVYVHYHLKLGQYIKYSILIGMTNLHYTITIMVFLFGIYYVSMKIPGIVPFFSFSLAAYITMFWSYLSFQNLQKKREVQESSSNSIVD